MINEKQLIEDLKNTFSDSVLNQTFGFGKYSLLEALEEMINRQPQIVTDTNVGSKCSDCSRRKFYQQGYQDGLNADKWIPCEERLPSEYGQYLYTDKNDEVHEGCYCPPYQGMISGWSTCEADGYVRLSDDDVIAWTNLPQSYKKEGVKQ